MNTVRGKWGLVTGASRGIGREAACFLAQQGMNLVLHSRSLEHTKSLAEELKSQYGIEVLEVAAHLEEVDEVRSLIEEVAAQVEISYLFNNAGYQFPSQTEPYHVDPEEYLFSYRVNVIAPMLLMEAFLPPMLENGFGRIVNTTSGIQNQPEQGAYAASKGALDKITKDYAATVQGDVTINLVDPGWIQTDLGGQQAPNTVDSVVPGVVAPAFANSSVNGRFIRAQELTGLTLEKAVAALEGDES